MFVYVENLSRIRYDNRCFFEASIFGRFLKVLKWFNYVGIYKQIRRYFIFHYLKYVRMLTNIHVIYVLYPLASSE